MPQMNLSRRKFLQKLLVSATTLVAIPHASAALLDGFLFNPCGTALPQHLLAHPIVAAAWQGIDPAQLWDTHAHIAGTGDSDSGIFTTHEMNSLWHPMQYTQRVFYLNAGCTEKGRVDHSFIERLSHLTEELNQVSAYVKKTLIRDAVNVNTATLPQAKLMLFAFEQAHDEAGKVLRDRTAFHVPNSYAQAVAKQNPQYFEWVCSIHPYRPDALAALEAAVANGARAVKWLPSAMGIDPASAKCDAFYQSLSSLNIPLICHAGEEKAVDGMGFHDANNPLKMRRAMDAGVRVVMAHCASIGEDIDLDIGVHGPHVPSFSLFSRLMADPQYKHHLFADISAITLRNRSPDTVRSIIDHQDWHGRLLNGSDYPLPGVVPLFSLGKLAKAGLLDGDVVPVLEEIQNYNPLLFDFVLKRQLRSGKLKLSNNIFHTRDFFLRSIS